MTEKKPCAIRDCKNNRRSKDYCATHQKRFQKYGDPMTFNASRGGGHNKMFDKCQMDDCNNKHLSKGFCAKHYRAFVAFCDKDRTAEARATIRPHSEKGYRNIYKPDHPYSSKYGIIKEHRLVMEEIIGRYLEKHENVHHKNGNRKDNRPENLELWSVRQPKGQRVEDKVEYAIEILRLYAPEYLSEVKA